MPTLMDIGEDMTRKITEDGQASLTTCIKVVMKENENLRRKQEQLLRVINIYKGRLQQHNLSTASGAEDHELVVHDTSQKILDELSRNNAQLKVKLQHAKQHKLELEEELNKKNKAEEERVPQQLSARIQRLEQEKQEMQQQIDAVIQSNKEWQDYFKVKEGTQQRQAPQLKDRETLLEAQIAMCTEDFKAEEREKMKYRQRAHDAEAKLMRLQQHVSELTVAVDLYKRQLDQFQAEKLSELSEQRQAAQRRHEQQSALQRGISGIPDARLRARGIGLEADCIPDDDIGHDTVDGLPIPRAAYAPGSSSRAPRTPHPGNGTQPKVPRTDIPDLPPMGGDTVD